MKKSKQILTYIIFVGMSLAWILAFDLFLNYFGNVANKPSKFPADFLLSNFVSFSFVWIIWKSQGFGLTPLKYWLRCLTGITLSTILVMLSMYIKSFTNNSGWGVLPLIIFFIGFYPLISFPSSLMIFLISYPLQLLTNKYVSSESSLA